MGGGGGVTRGRLGPLPQKSWEPRRAVGRAEKGPDLGAHRSPVVAAAVYRQRRGKEPRIRGTGDLPWFT